MKTNDSLQTTLETIFAQVLGLNPEELRQAGTFSAMGISSINAVRVLEAVNTAFDLSMPTSVLFECHDLSSLARHIQAQGVTSGRLSSERHANIPSAVGESPVSLPPTAADAQQVSDQHIAVIGIACRCAGADDQYQFWELIQSGRDCIRAREGNVWETKFRQHGGDKPVPAFGGFMQGIDLFDPLFFKISPKESEAMDPCQRILLEECYVALEDAGQNPQALSDAKVALFVGTMGSQYPFSYSHYSMLGNESSIMAGRLAYFLNLKGPALSVNTACSSSLVALELAAEKLRNREVDLALAAGVTIYTNPDSYLLMNNAGMLAPDGRCKPFDDSANGIVVGDGVGVVVIKRLEDALRDGDQVYAILEGIGINQDGKTSGLTVPSFLSQSALQQHVYRKYRINPEQIQYLETHGTGTRLGDPIEIHALTDAFSKFTNKKQFCAVGSLKANIGHTTAAAGVLSMIKTLLAIRYRMLPPSIHCLQENRHIDFADSPFYVNKQRQDWVVAAGQVRRAAVSSFGFSGTNAHLVLKEFIREPAPPHTSGTRYCVPLSAYSAAGLQKKGASLWQFLRDSPARGSAASQCNRELLELLAQAIGIPVRDIRADSEFGELGMDRYSLSSWYTQAVLRFPELPLPVLQDSIQSLSAGLALAPLAIEQLAYTLQVGREAMPQRCVFLVRDLADLQQQLQRFVEQGIVAELSGNDSCVALARAWLDGGTPDWRSLYPGRPPYKISLPGHVFERQSYWLPDAPMPDATLAVSPGVAEADSKLLELAGNLSGEQLLAVLRQVICETAS
jgi:polyketide synthase PksM